MCSTLTPNLLEIAPQLEQTLSSALKGITVLKGYLQKRQTLESTFAKELSAVLKDSTNGFASPMTMLFSEMRAYQEHHFSVALEIEECLMPPITAFLSLLAREQKSLSQAVLSAAESMKVLDRRIYVAQSQAEKARLETLQHSPAKSSRRRSLKPSNDRDLSEILNERARFLQNLEERQIPKFLSSTAELDFGFRSIVKDTVITLASFEQTSHKRLLADLAQIHTAADCYEPGIDSRIMEAKLRSTGSKRRLFAIVRCDYPGDGVNDLQLVEGQVVEIVHQDQSGWWQGDAGGRTGTFPMSFVDIVADGEDGVAIGESFEIIMKYTAKSPGELTVDYGEIVVVQSISKEWCTGYNIVTRERGRFPLACMRDQKLARSLRLIG
jgi:hypothetical protein